MRCNVCHGPVAFERTVFQGPSPTTVRLCHPCAEQVDVQSHLEAIKNAGDKAAKNAAIGEFLTAVDSWTEQSSASNP